MTASIPLPICSTAVFSSLFFRRKKALERTDGKNSKLFSFSNRVKPAWLQGFWWTKRTAPRRISSQARYDRFDTSPFDNYSVFGESNMISSAGSSPVRTTRRVSIRKSFPKLLERSAGDATEYSVFRLAGPRRKTGF